MKRLVLTLILASAALFLLAFHVPASPPEAGDQSSLVVTPTPTPVPIGPDNPLGQYVKKSRLRSLVLVTVGGTIIALALTALNRRR